jgi:hypothetical protein
MRDEPAPLNTWRNPILNAYRVVCLAALGVIALEQAEQGVPLTLPLLLLVGLLGILLPRTHTAPLLLLLLTAASHYYRRVLLGIPLGQWYGAAGLRVADVAQCAAFLAYFAAHYRLQALLMYILPPDPRRRVGPPQFRLVFLIPTWKQQLVEQRRSTQGVGPAEVSLLVLTLPVWAVLAQYAWLGLSSRGPLLEIPVWATRLLLLLWILGVGLLVASALLSWWKRRTMTPAEAHLYLQDVLWQETRREQRRLNRWLAWARLRRRPRKEQS